jgi:hypothetical protein
MLQNPIVQTLAWFVGAYSAMRFLQKLAPADVVVTVLCGLYAATIWMLRYNRGFLYSLYTKPAGKMWIDFVCKTAKEQAPVDASLDNAPGESSPQSDGPRAETQEQDRLRLRTDQDFGAAARQIREAIKGHDDIVDALMDQVRRNIQLRESSVRNATLPPLGVFLLAGRSGLGKRSLAIEVGSRIYKNPGIAVLSASDPGVHGGLLVDEAKINPFTTFVIDDFAAAPQQFQTELLNIFAGAPQTDSQGGRVSFRHCVFFLLLHRDAANIPRPKKGAAGTGETVVVEALTSTVDIDKRLAWSVHGVYPFVLPSQLDQAAVVAQIMEIECRKYNVGLGFVNAAILAREVEITSAHGGFEITPARVGKLMHDRILAAVANREQLVDLGNVQTAPAYDRANYV